MSAADLGESLVGAYMRHVEQCSIVLYNSSFADQQGEVDVVAVKPQGPGDPRVVYLCEVTTHIGAMATNTVKKVPAKLGRLREFAAQTFPDEEHRFQWWSPYVNEGTATASFKQLVRSGTPTAARWSSSSTRPTRAASSSSSRPRAASHRRRTNRRSECCRYSRTCAARSRSCE